MEDSVCLSVACLAKSWASSTTCLYLTYGCISNGVGFKMGCTQPVKGFFFPVIGVPGVTLERLGKDMSLGQTGPCLFLDGLGTVPQCSQMNTKMYCDGESGHLGPEELGCDRPSSPQPCVPDMRQTHSRLSSKGLNGDLGFRYTFKPQPC